MIAGADTQMWVSEVLQEAALRPSRVSAWETEFMAGLRVRLVEHGARLRISEKQMAVLKQIEEKIYAID